MDTRVASVMDAQTCSHSQTFCLSLLAIVCVCVCVCVRVNFICSSRHAAVGSPCDQARVGGARRDTRVLAGH